MTLEELVARLEGAKGSATKGYTARCPAHDDRSPSLSVSAGRNGGIVLHCHAGCSHEAILAALQLRDQDLAPPSPNGSKDDWTPYGPAVAVYHYVDEQDRLLFDVCRTASKQFPQRVPDPLAASGYRWRLGEVRRVLYRLPAVVDAIRRGAPVYIVEGEKDVQALEYAGCVATCNPGGAGKWRREYAQVFRGARVVVVGDRDEAGRRHAADVVASLRGIAQSVELREAAEGKDVSDHLAAGRTVADLVAASPPTEAPGHTTPDALPSALRLLDAPPPEPVEWIATGFLLRDINVLAGEGEAGKSTLALAIAGALANGSKVLGQFPTARPRVVLLVWEEDGHDLAQNRLEALIAGHRWDRERVLGNLYLHAQHGICLDDTEWQTQIGREAADLDVDLVMVDTVGTAMKGSDMVKPETKVVTTFCRALVQGGRGVLLLAHVSKPSEQRPAKRHRLFGSVEWYNASRMAWWVDRRDTGASLECIKASRTRKPDPLTVVRRVKTDPENEAVWQSATMVLGKETSDPAAVSDLDIAVLRVLCHTLQAPTSTELRLLVRRGGGKGTNEDVQTSLAALLALNLIRWERVGKAKNWHATDEGRAIYLSLKGQPQNA